MIKHWKHVYLAMMVLSVLFICYGYQDDAFECLVIAILALLGQDIGLLHKKFEVLTDSFIELAKIWLGEEGATDHDK